MDTIRPDPQVDADRDLLTAVRAGLAALADPVKAPQMQAYMKSAMPYRGVATPPRRTLMKELLAARPPTARATWAATVRALWDGAAYREERYAAIDLCGHRSARAWQDAATVPLYEHFIVTGAWWDHVDAVAIHLVGPILRADPAGVGPTIRRWITAEDRWLRRSAIIVQIGTKRATDTALLVAAIEPHVDDRDFFIRKGIGWALREYAKTDPEWVRSFVATHELSALSRREATRHLA
jgi:3-methyladenine DNA glycosylase AlkD